MRFAPAALLVALMPGQAPADDAGLRALAEAERAFAQMSVEQGMRAAFYENFAEDGIHFTPHPVVLRERARQQPAPPATAAAPVLDWYPVLSDLAGSGELGYNTGPWTLSDPSGARPPRHGFFFSVWKRQGDGAWKVVLDLGVAIPEPFAPDTRESWHAAAGERWTATAPLDAAEAAASLREAEHALETAIAADGAPRAYAERLASEVRFYVDGQQPFLTREAITRHLEKAGSRGARRFETRHAEAARSGELGYTWGAYSVAAPEAGTPAETGYYAHVWRRDANGRWTLAVEVIAPLPPEAPR